MARLIYTLSINGGDQVAPEELDLALGGLTLQSMAVDTLTLSSMRSMGDAAPLVFDDWVRLYRDGVKIFEGWVMPPSNGIAVEAHKADFVVGNIWWKFERIIWGTGGFYNADGTGYLPYVGFEATRASVPGEVYPGSSHPAPPEGWIHHFWYGNNIQPTYPSRIWYENIHKWTPTVAEIFEPEGLLLGTVAKEFIGTLRFAKLVTGGNFQTESNAAITAALGAHVTPPLGYVSDTPISETIRSHILSYKPTLSIWFDYATSPPTMRLLDGPLETAQTVTLATDGVIAHTLKPRPDVVPSSVIVKWVWGTAGPGYDRYSLRVAEMYPPAGVAYKEDAITVTIVTWGGDTFIPMLAQPVFEELAQLRCDGTLTIERTTEGLGTLRPGRVWEIAGDPQLVGAKCMTRSVMTDLSSDIVTLTMGLPNRLGVEKVRELRKYVMEFMNGWL